MKNKLKLMISFLGINVLMFSCTETFELNLERTEPKVVIQGLVTNLPGPYFVRLTKTTNELKVKYEPGLYAEAYDDHTEIIENAVVIISDNQGNSDTLIPSPYHNYIYYHGDSIMGYYCTQNLIGVVGREYYLDVFADGKYYHAESIMIDAPVIDSIYYSYKEGDIGKPTKITPQIYLDKINNNVLYGEIFFTREEITHYNLMWWYSMLVDLNDYPTDLPIPFYAYAENGKNYLEPYDLSEDFQWAIVTMDEKAYNFNKTCYQQFWDDGGAYKPAPATPIGNISGDAIGVFQVSGVSIY
ncbi:MAG: DUF4249 family protein [Bacteroidales bacterium]|nr:DUF4249 family protein [Bacteroidales bacterium]